jgi:hypothetical protein
MPFLKAYRLLLHLYENHECVVDPLLFLDNITLKETRYLILVTEGRA